MHTQSTTSDISTTAFSPVSSSASFDIYRSPAYASGSNRGPTPLLGWSVPNAEVPVRAKILKTPDDRSAIAHLRQYADSKSEYELDPSLAEFEALKDGLGIVMSISRGDRVIATIRFIPAGYGVTLTERYWKEAVENTDVLSAGSWEVGRLVIAPEDRNADLLPKCLAAALQELMKFEDVRHFHASCLLSMTRLYRKFGFSIVGTAVSATGKSCAVIHAEIANAASALKVPTCLAPASEPVTADLN